MVYCKASYTDTSPMDMFGKLLAVECLYGYYIRTEIYALKRREINSVHKLVKRAAFFYE